MNILVTGCAGFIASHIIEELLKNRDNTIIGIDNFHSGKKENIDLLQSLDKYNKFIFEQIDIRNFDNINNIMQIYNIKQVYHLAAVVSVQESIQNPLFSNEVNVKGTLNILEASRLNAIKRVVFSSSAAVYGDEPSQPKNEDSLTKPISPYGYDKLIGEQYMALYNQLHNIETIVLRYFNVYGQRQSSISDYSGIISIFDNKLKNKEIPNIYGDGEQYRDFIHVKDIAKINIQAMNEDIISNETFCVGTGKKTSINNLLLNMNEKYSENIKANYLKKRNGDIKKSICDNNKIVSIFKIKEFKELKEGIISL